MTFNYKNLVFEGGGVKGIAYAGALTVLNNEGILPNIQRVAGTSAGAITAALVALGYSASELKETIFEMDFKKFEDGWDPLRIATHYGRYKGDDFLQWMKSMVAAKA